MSVASRLEDLLAEETVGIAWAPFFDIFCVQVSPIHRHSSGFLPKKNTHISWNRWIQDSSKTWVFWNRCICWQDPSDDELDQWHLWSKHFAYRNHLNWEGIGYVLKAGLYISFTTFSDITMFTILLVYCKVVGIWFNCGFQSVGQPRLIAKAARWRQEPKLITAQLKMAAMAAPSAALQLLRRLQAWDGLWRVGFVMQLLEQIFELHVFGTFTNCTATSLNIVLQRLVA